MSEEEIKEYLKRFDELELKLTDEDKDTYQWLLFGYNKCARLLNEKEQENQQLKEVIEEVKRVLRCNNIEVLKYYDEPSETGSYEIVTVDLLQILDKAKN